MHAANRAGLGRGRRALRGLVRRGGRAHPVRRLQPVPGRAGPDRRPPRPVPAGDPPPVRRWPRHALAVEPRARTRWSASTSARGCWTRPAADRGDRRAATWVEADVLDVPHELDGTADLLYTGRGAIIWLQDLDRWAAVLRRLLAPDRAARDLRRPPGRVAVRRGRGRRLDRDRLRLLRRRRGVARLGARVHRPALDRRRTTSTGSSPGRGRWARSSRRCWAPACGSSA